MKKEITKQLILVGGGPSSLFVIMNMLTNFKQIKPTIDKILILEKNEELGPGMPFSDKYNDLHNLANITGEEIPALPQKLDEWLSKQSKTQLNQWNINPEDISEKELYPRIVLGNYFKSQFHLIIKQLEVKGFTVAVHTNEDVIDIYKHAEDNFEVKANPNKSYYGNIVVISTGHGCIESEKNEPKSNYFSCPWPIASLFPERDKLFNFEIGILGASLSAFDVTSALAHKHGQFIKKGNQLEYQLHKGAENFKITLHTSEGLLPHLQYEQRNAMRKIFRHLTKNQIDSLLDSSGFLSLTTYFNQVMRAALVEAFTRDELPDMASLMQSPTTTFADFIGMMKEKHHYFDSFEGLKFELKDAIEHLRIDKPTHWMETLDDLMYSLNFHIDLLSAEDRIFLQKEIFSFLMNVIAALPIRSAKILLALHDAGCIILRTGRVEILEEINSDNGVTISLSQADEQSEEIKYQKFINCGGQGVLDLNNYPFSSLLQHKNVTEATAEFNNKKEAAELEKSNPKQIIKDGETTKLKLGGVAVDAAYRLINESEKVSTNIYDISIQHILGSKPYSYGLQACNANAAVVVNTWIHTPLAETKVILESTDMNTIYKNEI